MPWKDILPVDERIRFIAAVQQDPREAGGVARVIAMPPPTHLARKLGRS